MLVPPVDLDLAIRLEHLLPGRFFSLSAWCEGLLTHLDGPRHARAMPAPAPELEDLAAQVLAALPLGQAFDGGG